MGMPASIRAKCTAACSTVAKRPQYLSSYLTTYGFSFLYLYIEMRWGEVEWEEMGGDGRRWEAMGGDERRWEAMGGGGGVPSRPVIVIHALVSRARIVVERAPPVEVQPQPAQLRNERRQCRLLGARAQRAGMPLLPLARRGQPVGNDAGPAAHDTAATRRQWALGTDLRQGGLGTV
jgi:hypothetical protein